MYQAKHQLSHLLAPDRNPSSNQFSIDVWCKITAFAIPNLLHVPPKTSKIRLESVPGLQTRRTAYEATKLHFQYARPGSFLSPMAGLRAAGSVIKPFVRPFKDRLCRSDTFLTGTGVPRSLAECVVASVFALYLLRIKAMSPRLVEPCAP